ncbi:RNA-binding protein [Sporomusa acidovorans]|uniref:RNA-binding S4 domain-containing protein n=1 Tax=Sporomusa acidovorans (strain ATCC 49682 / DSM 3132 / Mol) TaxID=1123286 RepID=A0ABZ3J323_SPOA4|nr:YlmH/Sll1252 family protein [Sporomusa acidovorans]OZC20248.1 S4 domain protein [Sporomusa acidovorans DSM 3132]SDD40636.1 RNA-binding protein YlmH, contains S4-like domain [Sporomusa acidovorans]
MNERDKILRYYRSSGDAELAAKLLDLAEIALKTKKYKVSDFLDPYGLSIAETIIAHYERLALETSGGYPGAERVKAAFVDTDFLEYADSFAFDLAAILIKCDSRYYHLSHRDVLGALMGLGIKREVLGDIIMAGDQCYLIADSAMAAYIIQNLTEVGQAVVSVAECALAMIPAKEEKVKEIRATVASLRLDAVAASGFGTSRTRMAEDITAAKIKINWQEAKSPSQAVKVGDIISMRGRGRIEVIEVPGQTKKGRYSILLKRFM